jgi:iron(III) transport system ATP-binding protein
MDTLLLEVAKISQSYSKKIVVNNLSFGLNKGAIGCLLGPSGCGKTTVLRCIAGFEPVVEGEVLLNGVRVSSSGFSLRPEQRHIGMVFQDYALFPHLTVISNIIFGLHYMSRKERSERAAEMIEIVGLKDVINNYPHELSGGQQQRVALARALAPKPDLLLLDEPFSNLDVNLRERLSLEVREILKSQGTTAILVTHDQNEAFAIADEIGVMQNGEIMQWDSAYNLYHRPVSRFVANFVGQGVFLSGKVLDSHHVEIELGTLELDISHQNISDKLSGKGRNVDVLIRPDDIVHDDESSLKAKVLHKAFRGAEILYTLRLPGGSTALSLVPSHHNHAIGEDIGIKLEVDHIVAFNQITQ